MQMVANGRMQVGIAKQREARRCTSLLPTDLRQPLSSPFGLCSARNASHNCFNCINTAPWGCTLLQRNRNHKRHSPRSAPRPARRLFIWAS